MSYDTIEAGALTVLQVLDAYSDDNSSRGDMRILGKGNDKNVVFFPGGFNRDIMGMSIRTTTEWEVLMRLFILYDGEISSSWSAIRTDRQAIIEHFDKYPTLNGVSGVVHAFMHRAPTPQLLQGEARQWWAQDLTLIVRENVSVTIAE